MVELQRETQGVEAFPWDRNLTKIGDPQKCSWKVRDLEAKLSEEIEEEAQDFVVFVVLFPSLSHRSYLVEAEVKVNTLSS